MSDVDEILEEALRLGERGEWPAMEKLLREAVVEHPDDAALLCSLGVAQHELGLAGMAYDTFRRCLANQPTDPHVLATAGRAVARFDDPDAEPALRSAALMAPDLPVARRNYGAYLAREGMFDDALRELDAALALAPDDAVVSVERAGALALQGDLAGAVEELERAVALDPQDGWPRILMGLALLQLERDEEGAAALVEGARLRESDPEAQVLAALAAAWQGWLTVAEEMVARGHLQAVAESDRALVHRAERAVAEGGRKAERFLVIALAPRALHERLMAWD